MPSPFSNKKNRILRLELLKLYTLENKSLNEIAHILRMSEGGTYKRLKKFNIPIKSWKKEKYANIKSVCLPGYSEDFAEFIGIMLGDGNITNSQIRVTSHAVDDRDYHAYIKSLMYRLFKVHPGSYIRKNSQAIECYLNSVRIVRFFKEMGLTFNKVKNQVKVPEWIFGHPQYQKACLRGIIDTDGSIYRLKSGNPQLSFKNYSLPLLRAARQFFLENNFSVSQISSNSLYLSRKKDVKRYFEEIGTSNIKHLYRYRKFLRAGTEVVKQDRL